MSNWFKNFFGFSENFRGGMPSDCFEDDEEDSDAFKDGFGSFHRHFFTEEPSTFRDSSRIFSEFEEILKNVEGMFRFGFDVSVPSIEGFQEHYIEGREEGKSLRDQMLKTPDTDSSIMVPHSSYSTNVIKSSSVIGGREGFVKSEIHQTVKDSDGNLNITVKRSLGDQTHAVTTKTDGSGKSEKIEEFINMDEKNLDDFEQRWHTQRRQTLPPEKNTPYDPLQLNEQLEQILLEKNTPDQPNSLDSSGSPIIQGYNFIRRLFGND